MARGVALGAAIAAALLLVGGAGGVPEQTPARGGTLVVGTLREPACLNAFFLRCSLGVPPAGHIMNLALRGAFEVGPGFTWRYDLVSRVDFTTRAPFTLTYRIKPVATWSDRVPVTAGDFVFTHATLIKLPEEDRKGLGLEFVRTVREVDAKTVRVVLRSPYAGWRGLFANVLPRHALHGENFANVWIDGIQNPKTGEAIGSGPFLVDGWERGRTLTFRRNPSYWGPHLAHLKRIVLRFCSRCSAIVSEQRELLEAGNLDLAMSIGASGEDVREFRRLPGVRVLAEPGPVWEHLDIRVREGGHTALRRKGVRQAIAYGIDRDAIARALFAGIDPAYPSSESAVHFSFASGYRPNWQAFRRRPTVARRLLEQEGCRPGADDIYVCDGERLSFRFVTVADDPLRVRTVELLQQQLRSVGIEVEPQYGPRTAVFNQILPSGDFDLILYSWISTAYTGWEDVYGCGGPQNYSGWCRRLVTRDLDLARRTLDDAGRAEMLNRIDVKLASHVPVIPMFERPLLAAFDTSVRGVSLSTRAWNPFANAENLWLER